MPVERRGQAIRVMIELVNWQQEEPDGLGGRRRPSTGGTSRVTGDGQARICERLGTKFPGPTRQHTLLNCRLDAQTEVVVLHFLICNGGKDGIRDHR